MINSTLLYRHASLPTLLTLLLPLGLALGPVDVAEAALLPEQLRCQKSISSSARKYLTTTLKYRMKCRAEETAKGVRGACENPRVIGRLSKAAAKMDKKLVAGCAGLSDTQIGQARPLGLSLGTAATLGPDLRGGHDRFAIHLVRAVYGEAPGDPMTDETVSREVADCQKALASATSRHLRTSIKRIGNTCVDKMDKGQLVEGDTFRGVELCTGLAVEALARDAAKAERKIAAKCRAEVADSSSHCAETAAGATSGDESACLFDRAAGVATAALHAEHGARDVAVRGTLTPVTGDGVRIHPRGAAVRLVDPQDGNVISSATTDGFGRFDLPVERFRSVELCWEHQGQQSCAGDILESGGGRELSEVDLPAPLGPDQELLYGRVLRADGSPCFEGNAPGTLNVRGGLTVVGSGGESIVARTEVAADGSYAVPIPVGASHRAIADCGDEVATEAISGSSAGMSTRLDVTMSSDAVPALLFSVTDTDGNAIGEASEVTAGDELIVTAAFTGPAPSNPTYHWAITRGEGELQALGSSSGAGGACPPPGLAEAGSVKWLPAGAGKVQQLVLWVADKNGGTTSSSFAFGPLDHKVGPVGPVPFDPCDFLWQSQEDLCGDGYDSDNDGIDDLPEPAGGRENFLTYKYRGDFNSENDACLYYNLIDPDCVDLNCDGILDPGSDPAGNCSRLTLGDWWTKNGFDPVTGLGADVESAFYLNSNDLGFGREMHCRVTGYSNHLLKDIKQGVFDLEARNLAGSAGRPPQPLSVDSYRTNVPLEVQGAFPGLADLFQVYPSTIACYVVNYTTDFCNNYPTNDPANADLALAGFDSIQADPTQNPVHAYGTVAMEFGPVEGFGHLGPITKFFVFDGRTASGGRLDAANLDGCGAKSVPEVCMACHGGSWPGTFSQNSDLDSILAGLDTSCELAGIEVGAPQDAAWTLREGLLQQISQSGNGFSSFLPFDIDTYQFPTLAPQGSQEAGMRKLNQLVKYARPSLPIKELVKGWYGNDFVNGTFTPWRPTAWDDDLATPADESALYEVYATACRVCHAAHYSFDQPGDFPGASRVCGPTGPAEAGGSPTMAHAKLTYQNFWAADFPQGPTRVLMEDYFGDLSPPQICD